MNKRIVVAAMVLWLQTVYLYALDLDRVFPQRIDCSFFSSCVHNPDQERAIFLRSSADSQPLIMYVSWLEKRETMRFRTSLGSVTETLLSSVIKTLSGTLYHARKGDGAPFYIRGRALKGSVSIGHGCALAEVMYVPRFSGTRSNDAFICDLGYLQVDVAGDAVFTSPRADELFETLLAALFKSGTVTVMEGIELNRYYFNRQNYRGQVTRLEGELETILGARAMFPATHKVTFYKRVRDWTTRKAKDRVLCLQLLRHDYPLLSQDERVKQGMVPAAFNLNPATLHNSDMAAGQNIHVFLTLGPGINYFDDPWREERRNVPGPRFVYSRAVYFFRRLQVYPSYSIAPLKSGVYRFDAINQYQVSDDDLPHPAEAAREPVYMDMSRRMAVLQSLTKSLLDYGLLNDTAELNPGFTFRGKRFRGNVVNNEVRLFNASYPVFETMALIVPAAMKAEYMAGYEEMMRLHGAPRFINGIHYEDYFIEAPLSTDAGMRMAYLELLLRESDRLMFRLLRRSRGSKRSVRPGYFVLAKICERLIRSEGIVFFTGPHARWLSERKKHYMAAYLDYLEAVRIGSETARIEYLYACMVSLHNQWMLSSRMDD